MKLAYIKQPKVHEDDVEKIVNIFASYGILAPRADFLLGWGLYSETKGEEWSDLPEKDEDVYLNLIDYFKVEDI